MIASVSYDGTLRRIPDNAWLLVYDEGRSFLQAEGLTREIAKEAQLKALGDQLLVYEAGQLQYIIIFESVQKLQHFVVLSRRSLKTDATDIKAPASAEEIVQMLQDPGFPDFVDAVERVLLSLLK